MIFRHRHTSTLGACHQQEGAEEECLKAERCHPFMQMRTLASLALCKPYHPFARQLEGSQIHCYSGHHRAWVMAILQYSLNGIKSFSDKEDLNSGFAIPKNED